ncbi:hypothetical protein [Mycobacterium genavense]|uniref:hypothetical protein n=1 Tax=Mycobacterium genavense TaxID=36812 RepID=UPI00046EA2F7|nr:hypothetical protein [Mycobacterium genavense]
MDYPIDHAGTPRQHAGETLKLTANIPGLIAVVVGVVTLGVGGYELVAGDVRIGLVAVILAAGSGVAGLGWLNFAQRRVRQAELQLAAMGSAAAAPPPSG